MDIGKYMARLVAFEKAWNNASDPDGQMYRADPEGSTLDIAARLWVTYGGDVSLLEERFEARAGV